MAKKAEHFFVKFDKEEALGTIKPFGKTATAVSYDEAENAALVTPTVNGGYESASIQFDALGAADCRQYPVFGIRLKLKNPHSKFGRFYWRTDELENMRAKMAGAGVDVGYWQFILNAKLNYAETTDWQVCYVDFSDTKHPYFEGNWLTTMLTMLTINGDGVTTEDGIYIDWMGWFASAKDLHDYAGMPYEAPETPVLAPNEQRAMESSLRIHNRLDEDVKKIPVERVLVSDYDPAFAFKHHPGISYFKGKFYVSFSNSVKDEDHPGQKMVYCVSDDFYHWSDPIDIVVPGVTPKTESVYTDAKTSIIGRFSVKGDTLYFMYSVTDYHPECFREDGSFNTNSSWKATYTSYCMRSQDGVTWSEPFECDPNLRYNLPLRSPYGTNRWYEFHGIQAAYSDDGEKWTISRLTNEQWNASAARCPGRLTESAGFQSPDGVVHNYIRSEAGFVWQNESYDGGDTWTEFYPTNFTSASTMFKCLYLPNNRIGWIGSPYYDVRWPLMLYVSDDGYAYNKAYLLCDDVYEQKEKGWAKSGHLGYPHFVIVDNYLYVFYSKQKEVTEILRVKLSDI